MNKRNQYTAEFKTKVVLEVLREEGTVSQIAARHGLNPVVLGRWKTEFLERATDVFKRGPTASEKELEEERKRVADLERKVGQLTYEVDWLKKKMQNWKPCDAVETSNLVDKEDATITVKRQCELLGINRTSV